MPATTRAAVGSSTSTATGDGQRHPPLPRSQAPAWERSPGSSASLHLAGSWRGGRRSRSRASEAEAPKLELGCQGQRVSWTYLSTSGGRARATTRAAVGSSTSTATGDGLRRLPLPRFPSSRLGTLSWKLCFPPPGWELAAGAVEAELRERRHPSWSLGARVNRQLPASSHPWGLDPGIPCLDDAIGTPRFTRHSPPYTSLRFFLASLAPWRFHLHARGERQTRRASRARRERPRSGKRHQK